MGDARGLEHANLFEPEVGNVVEWTLACSEDDRHDVELEFVDQPRGEVLTQDARAAPDRHVEDAR